MRSVDAVFTAGKDRSDLRIEPLCDSIADRTRRRRQKSDSPPRIYKLDRMVIDVYSRSNVAQGKITVNESIDQSFRNGIEMVVSTGLRHRFGHKRELTFWTVFSKVGV